MSNTQNPYVISKQLIKNGANIKEINNNETILTNYMIYNGDNLSLSLIKMFLKGGVDINKKLPLYNVDALEIAIDKKVVKITKELLEYKFKLYNKINDQKDIKKDKKYICKLQNRNNMNINAGYGQQNGYLIKQLLNNKQAELLHEEINNHIIHDKNSSTTRFKQNRKF